MSLEDDLRAVLRRAPAPPDFAARVLARTRAPRRLPLAGFRLAIVAAIVVAVLIPLGISQYRQRGKAIQARDQLIVALSIAQAQLQHVQEQIQHNTRHLQ